jgi:hypothetical protein
MSKSIIKSTADYCRFRAASNIPEPSPSRVRAMQRAMENDPAMAEYPIVCFKSGRRILIADGLKRFYAAQNLGLPIFYILRSAPISARAIGGRHRQNDQWGMQRWLRHYVMCGHPQYIKLKNFAERFDLPLTVSLELLGHPNGSQLTAFREGQFMASNEIFASQVAMTLQRIRPLLSFRLDRALITAVSRVMLALGPRFEVYRFVNKFDRQRGKLVKCSNSQQYIALIDEIYNDHMRPFQVIDFASAVRRAALSERRRAA